MNNWDAQYAIVGTTAVNDKHIVPMFFTERIKKNSKSEVFQKKVFSFTHF